MMPKAKAVLTDVKAFERTAAAARDYSKNLNLGTACLEELMQGIEERVTSLTNSLSGLDAAKKQVERKRREIESILDELRAKLNELREELSSLQAELAMTPPSFEETDENGITVYVVNPAYEFLKAEISDVRDRINAVRAEMDPYEERLERVKRLGGKITSKAGKIEGVLHSLERLGTECRTLLHELDDIKIKNGRNSAAASDNLKRLQKVIEKYKEVKMKYDSREVPFADFSANINISVNVMSGMKNQTAKNSGHSDEESEEFETADTSSDHVVYDEERHICEYNGRTFGGQYNSYKTRYDNTPKPDPMKGWYEGDRGESKYIPSERTAKGIVVAEILRSYGMNGIVYRNAEPDFEDCSEAAVTIQGMTEFREINFSRADIELANKWNEEQREGRRNWRPDDVSLYRKANMLSWHEKCDTRTMVLVRSEVNLFFDHLGGVAECKARDAAGEIRSEFDE